MYLSFHTLQTQYRHEILSLAERYLLEDVRVFGSTVRGEAHAKSDVDLLVHPKPGCSLLELVGFEIDVSALLGGAKVDVISDRAIKETIAPAILAEAKPL